MNDDTISRKATIDAILAVTGNSSVRELYEHVQEHELSDMWSGGVVAAIDTIIALPPAQPEKRTEERTETHACDLISRQAAIDALVGVTMFKTKHEIMQRVNASVQDEQGWLGAVAECLDEIEDLPSAQPEVLACGEGELIAQPEIIHCGDCRYKDDGIDEDGIPFLKCLHGRSYGGTRINDFCSWAERRTDEGD